MELIDISRPLSPATAVWPGDRPVEWSWTTRVDQGGSVNVGAIQLSTHAGTHADAPKHVIDDGETSDAFSLSAFVGVAEVIEVLEASAIRPHHVADVQADRILFKTSASDLPTDTWPESVTPLHPEAVVTLENNNTLLVGTDAPSIDPLDSTDLPAHRALIEAGIVNLEGLALNGVEPGRYGLLSLPLKIQGADAAPVRAVLGDVSLF